MSSRVVPRVLLAVAVFVQLVVSVVALATTAPRSNAHQTLARVSTTVSNGTILSNSDADAQAAVAPTLDEGARRTAVRPLLDRWAAAVRGADLATLSELFDPRADAGFVASEQSRAQNLREVPLSYWRYEISSEPPPTIPPGLVTRLQADEVWAPSVTLRYALAGVDATPTTRPVGLVLARRGSTWRLVSDTAVSDYGRTTWRGPWDFGPVVARTVPQGVVLGHPDRLGDVTALADDLGPAVDAVTQFWGPNWQQKAAVLVPSTQAELKSLVGTDFSGGGIAAVSIADEVDKTKGTALGQRVVFNPSTIGKLTALSRRVVLRHELTHVVTRAITAPQAPVWLTEGFADYSGYRNSGVSLADGAPAVAALVRTAGPPDRLPTDVQFSAGSTPAHVELAYQLSWTFSVFLASTRDEATLRSVYRVVAALPAPSATDIDAALLPVVGTSLATLVGEWGRWLQDVLG